MLFGGLAGHTLLETGRDALFLARLSSHQLPWMYLALAAVVVLFTRTRAGRLARGRSLPPLLASCALGTFLFWLAGPMGTWTLRALYVWTGLVATLTSIAFWLLLGEIFTIAQARRLYAPIGLGSQLGAIAGALAARSMSSLLDAHHLLAASAAVFLLTALGPARLVAAAARAAHPEPPLRAAPEPLEPLIVRNAYLGRLAGLVLLSTVAYALGDYVFKSAVAQAVAPRDLAGFFASFYLGLSVLSILAQLLLSGWLMRSLGVSRALAVLPLCVLLAALGVAAGAGLAGAVLLKVADGSLRPSLNRVGIELLFVPVPEERRAAAKPAVDVLGARGGQALASVFILGALATGAGDTTVAVAAAVTCVAWTGVALSLRPHYLDVFRAAVREGTLLEPAALPPLDLSSLEALFAALSSPDDGEVLAALELLASQGRARLVPALLLHHPSKAIVLRTLALLAPTGRTDWVALADRLLSSPDPEIRTAALSARTTARAEEGALHTASRDASPLVRATALVGLIASGSESEETWQALEDLAASRSLATRIALVEAIERQPAPAFERVLLRLARSRDERLAVHLARAMAKLRSAAFLPTLVAWLSVREVREAARSALSELGQQALAALDAALQDPRTEARVRQHIPRTISVFPPEQAVAVLQRQLAVERDGRVRFKILRGLGRIASDHPEIALHDGLVREAAARTVEAAVQALRFRVGLEKGAERVEARATPAHRLLVMLLRDKEAHRIERFFRLLQLRLRGEDVRSIHRGLLNADRRVRAASRELLENLLEEPLRGTLIALVDDLPPEERLARIITARVPARHDDYAGLLAQMARVDSPSLRSLAAFHAAELGIEMDAVPGPFWAVAARTTPVLEQGHGC